MQCPNYTHILSKFIHIQKRCFPGKPISISFQDVARRCIWGLFFGCKHNLRRCFQDFDVYVECVFLPPPLTEENWMSPFQVWVVFKFSKEHWWVLEPMIFMLKPTLKILKYWQHNIFLISKSWSYWESIVCAECLIGNDSDLIPVASSDFQSSPQMTRFAHVFFPQVFFEGASLVLPFNLLFPNLLFTKEIPSRIRGQPPGPLNNRFCKSWHRFGAAGLTASVVCAWDGSC